MGRLYWKKSRLNEVIAGYLKSKYPESLEVNTTGNVIVIEINKRFTLKKEDLVEALKIYGYPEAQARGMVDRSWGNFILNKQGLEIEKFNDNEIVLVPSEGTRVISLRIPYELYNKLNEKAEREGKTMTDIVIEGIRKVVES